MLRERGYQAKVVTHDSLREALDINPDVVVLPRHDVTWLNDWILHLRNHGKVMVYDADDDVWSDEIGVRQLAFFDTQEHTQIERDAEEKECNLKLFNRRSILDCFSGITVSTTALAESAAKYTNRPIAVVPNCIDISWFEQLADLRPRTVPGLTVGWAGGWRPESDIDPLPSVWAELVDSYPEITFVIYGYQPKSLVSAVPLHRLVAIQQTSFDFVPSVMRNIDIMCCVLPNTEFNRGKSWNKWMEASVAGAASVVSPCVYGDVVTNGKNALVAETPQQWLEAIERLILDSKLRSNLRYEARLTVEQNYNLDTGYQRWIGAWKSFTR